MVPLPPITVSLLTLRPARETPLAEASQAGWDPDVSQVGSPYCHPHCPPWGVEEQKVGLGGQMEDISAHSPG